MERLTLDLFPPDPETTFAEYAAVFNHWSAEMRRKGQIKGPSAIAVYEDMWLALASHMTDEGRCVPVGALSVPGLASFVESRESRSGTAASPRYVWRLLQLIHRVLAHAARDGHLQPNEAPLTLLATRNDWLYANARVKDTPEYVPAAKAARLIAVLSSARPRPGRQVNGIPWQDVRNKTSVALQLGGGLTPAEVREMKVDCAVMDGEIPRKVRVPPVGSAAARETTVAPWAGRLLKHWHEVRRALDMPGEWLFPSTKKGSQWTKPAQYLAARAVLLAAGWSEEEAKGGSFRLRHTYAVRQLRRGIDEKRVAQWLGIEPEAMERYAGVLLDFEPTPD